MPRRPKDVDLFEDMPTQEEVDFETFLEEVGPGTSTIDVFRALRDGSREHVDKVGVSVLQEDVYGFLRDSYGPGKYFLYFKGADRRYKGGKTLQVGALKLSETGTAVVRPNGNESEHLTFMREQNVMLQNMVMAMVAGMKGPDIGSLLQGIGALAPKPTQSDPAAMLTAVATVFTTLRGPEKDEDWLARAKTILELAQSMNGGNNGEDSGWSVLKEVGKEVARKIDLSALAPAKGVLAAPNPAPTPLVEVSSDGGDREIPKVTNPQATIEQWLRASLQYLKTKAALNKDPGVYIEHILDDPEEPQNAAIIEAIRKGATLEHLYAYDTEIGNNPFYRGWFEQLYEGLRSELLQSAVDTSGAGGNAGDTPGDEKASTGSE